MAKAKEKPLNEEEQALTELALELTKVLDATNETFMLGGPMALTVKKPNNTFSKQAHIGSEDFAPLRCYLGKRGKFIYVFKPVMVSDYAEMEIDESLAYSSLVGFKDWLDETFGKVSERKAEIMVKLNARAEQDRLSSRFETYKDIGFGSW